MENNLRHSFKFHAVGDETNFTYMVKVNSPLLANVKVYKFGSNKNRKKLNHVPDLELTASKVTEPIVKGKNYKKRTDIGSVKEASRERSKSEETSLFEKPAKGLLRKSSVKLDEAQNYSKK